MIVLSLVVLFLSLSFGDKGVKKTKNFNDLRGCSFDKFEKRSCLNKYFFSDLVNNNPRPSEYLRLKLFFTDKRPIICIQNENHNQQITFGEIYQNFSSKAKLFFFRIL